MIFKVFTVYDSKVEAYMNPFYLPAKGAAIRTFTDLVNDKSHPIGKYPADYTLFEIGSYDDQNGQIVMHKTHVSLGVGTEFLSA